MGDKKNNDISQMSDREIMMEMLELNRKMVKSTRNEARFTAGVMLVLLVVALLIVPKVLITLTEVNNTIRQLQGSVSKMDSMLDDVNAMTKSITNASDGLNDMIVENSEELSEAVQKLSSVDFEGLNEAIRDLRNTTSGLSKITSIFG